MNLKRLHLHWTIIAVLFLAAFLRLYRIDAYMEFLGDQGRDVTIVSNFLHSGRPFFIGPQTSIGNMYLGPFYYYLIIVPGLLLGFFNPIGPAIIVALIGVATVGLIYLVTKKWFNPQAAILAAFLYAISPVVIKYSNFSWNPNIMPFFALLFIYFMVEFNLIFATLAFIICLNSHYLALLLLPVAVLIWIFNFYSQPQKRLSLIKTSIICLGIFIISLVPQILFDIKHHGQNLNALLTFFTQRETTVNIKAYKALPELIPLFNQVTTRLLGGKNETFGLYLSVIFFLLLIYTVFKSFQNNRRQPYLIVCFLWLFFGLVGMGLYKQHIYDHYYGFIFPVVFILMGIVISKINRFVGVSLLIILTVFALLENPFRWQAPKQLETTRKIDDSIVDRAHGQPFNLALLAKQNYDPPYRYFLNLNHHPLYDLHDKLTEQLFVICEPFQIKCEPINNPEWGVAAFGWAKIAEQWTINGITIFRMIHNPTGISP